MDQLRFDTLRQVARPNKRPPKVAGVGVLTGVELLLWLHELQRHAVALADCDVFFAVLIFQAIEIHIGRS